MELQIFEWTWQKLTWYLNLKGIDAFYQDFFLREKKEGKKKEDI